MAALPPWRGSDAHSASRCASAQKNWPLLSGDIEKRIAHEDGVAE